MHLLRFCLRYSIARAGSHDANTPARLPSPLGRRSAAARPLRIVTLCDYHSSIRQQGRARIASKLYEDGAWYYPEPQALVTPIAGHIACFQERVDAVYVDGEKVERPRTPRAR